MREVESAPEWLLDKLNTESSDNLIKIATVIWGVWSARNQRVWEGKVISPEVAMAWSSKQVVEWREAKKRKHIIPNQLQRTTMQHASKWVAPDIGTLKLNVEASIFEGADSFSVGMVLINHQGLFVHRKTMRFVGRVTVLEVEPVGILEALMWSAEVQEQVIAIESDYLLSVQAINKAEQNQLEVGDLIAQCRSILSSKVGVSVVFVKKHANKVTHSLAKLPCTLNSFIDLSSPPLCVLETLLSDV